MGLSVPLLARSDSKPQLGAPLSIGNACSFRSFRTNNYKLHFMESPSGIKVTNNCFADAYCLSSQNAMSSVSRALSPMLSKHLQIVFNTDQSVGNLQDCLAYIYSNLYIEYVVKNPLYEPGQPFRCVFANGLLTYGSPYDFVGLNGRAISSESDLSAI